MSDSEKFVVPRRSGRRRGPSLFGPIVLIAVGVFFLLSNLDMLPGESPNWVALLQLWPLWLIFLGVNIIVRLAPGALGTLLSALVGLVAVAVVAYILFFAEDNAFLSRLRARSSVDLKTESIEYPADDIDTADIAIEFNSPGADLFALDDSNNLIEGTVSYRGELRFDASASGGHAELSLDTTSANTDWTFFMNPANWTGLEDRWQIGLNPRVDTDLRLDVGSGSVRLDLSELSLQAVEVIGGSGSTELMLADGEYEVYYDAGSGSTRMTLPARGRQEIVVEGGSGSITLYLLDSVEARVEVTGGSGSFNVDRDRFNQLRGDEPDEGVWETSGYDDAPDRVDLIIDVGSGSVTIRQP